MKKTYLGLLSFTSLLFVTQPASALFVNGGFETGDTTGWTIDAGRSTSANSVDWNSSGSGSGSGKADVIDSTATMTGQTLDINPYNGNYMVRINDIFGSYDATKISQTDNISQQDIDDGATLYINWGAALIDPSHSPGYQPFFEIDLSVNGAVVQTFSADATDASTNPDWVNAGSSGGTLWYKADVWSFDLSTFSVGDAVTLEMFASDCNLGGHGGYAFLDGIGTVYNPPDPGSQPVPEPATALLMCAGLVGLLGYNRKRFFKKS
jgi:hypothetical protein